MKWRAEQLRLQEERPVESRIASVAEQLYRVTFRETSEAGGSSPTSDAARPLSPPKRVLAPPLEEAQGKSLKSALLWKQAEDEVLGAFDIKQVLGFDTSSMEKATKKLRATAANEGHGEAISTNARERARAGMSRCQRFIMSPGFDQVSGFVILLHCFSVGMEADQRARNPVEACGGLWVAA
eukprot:s2896_g10.t1